LASLAAAFNYKTALAVKIKTQQIPKDTNEQTNKQTNKVTQPKQDARFRQPYWRHFRPAFLQAEHEKPPMILVVPRMFRLNTDSGKQSTHFHLQLGNVALHLGPLRCQFTAIERGCLTWPLNFLDRNQTRRLLINNVQQSNSSKARKRTSDTGRG
jgi:hypothetical protein